MADPDDVLARVWGIHADVVTPLRGGMNSQTWAVRLRGADYVLKCVAPTHVADLAAGCEVAEVMTRAGIVCGQPVRAPDGRLVSIEDGAALLEWVPGEELVGATDDQQDWMADTLASVHRAGDPGDNADTADFMDNVLGSPRAALTPHPWLVRAIAQVRAETRPLSVTWSLLHTDPAPEAFRHDDGTGLTGLIDWSGARRGPVLYDVASVVMYLGGPARASAFLRRYRVRGSLAADELAHLDAFRRLRWAVQASYFAERIARRELTGIADEAENVEGLCDAREGLEGLGVR